MLKDGTAPQKRGQSSGSVEEGLGPTSDIGARLRALYGAVQDEGVPDHFLDLLEKLDAAEARQRDGDQRGSQNS